MNIVKDVDCTIDTPVTFGNISESVYGYNIEIQPQYPGKQVTLYDKKYYLPKLLPLEEYDQIIVLFSGGKDSVAAYLKLIELGVPKEKISLWHHDINGKHPHRKMDWPVTQAYVKSFAEAESVSLRLSWRMNGFFGALYRIGASYPIEYEYGNEIRMCHTSEKQQRSQILRSNFDKDATDELKMYGCRLKFPAKSGNLTRRWCSSHLKIEVGNAVIRSIAGLTSDTSWFVEKTPMKQTKILIISGERRGESAGRAKYNEMAVHTTNATTKAGRLVHQWRIVIDHSERDIWEIIKRHGVVPHPCYYAGWSRCSCMMCIFSLPKHWAGVRELFPKEFEMISQDEITLNFNVDNKKNLKDFIADARSCVCYDNLKAIGQLITGIYTSNEVYIAPDKWMFPAGAFHGSAGGPC